MAEEKTLFKTGDHRAEDIKGRWARIQIKIGNKTPRELIKRENKEK